MRFPKWLRCVILWSLLGAAGLALLAGGFYTVVRWRGDRAWSEYAAESATRGETLDVLPVPSTLPPERNFMKTPVLERWMFSPIDDPAFQQFLEEIHATKISGLDFGSEDSAGWADGESVDFAKTAEAWFKGSPDGNAKAISSEKTPARRLLAAFAPMDSSLDELRRAALARPDSELVRPTAIDHQEPLKSPIARFQLARVFSLGLAAHGCAALVAGKAKEAFGDTLAELKFSRGFTAMPDSTLVDSMIGTVIAKIALQPLWEGCQRNAWSDQHLRQFEDELSAIRPIESLKRGLRTDRASFMLTFDHMSGRVYNHSPWLFWFYWPRGWIQQSKVAYCTCMQEAIDVQNAAATPGFLKRKAGGHARMQALVGSATLWTTPSTYLGLMAVPAIEKPMTAVAGAEAFVALARTACALERHRLAHGSYPEAVAALVPEYLPAVPRDVIDGQPLRYRRLADDGFKVWSIGIDGRDDDGTPVKSSTQDARGDWVWLRLAK